MVLLILTIIIDQKVLINDLGHDSVSARDNAKHFLCQVSEDMLKCLEYLILYPKVEC